MTPTFLYPSAITARGKKPFLVEGFLVAILKEKITLLRRVPQSRIHLAKTPGAV